MKEDFVDDLHLKKNGTSRTCIAPINLVSLSGIDIYVTRLLIKNISLAVLNFVRRYPWLGTPECIHG